MSIPAIPLSKIKRINSIALFKMFEFPSNCDYFWRWVGLNGTQILDPSDYEIDGKEKLKLFVLMVTVTWR